MARPLRGAGGKGRAIKEKKLFKNFLRTKKKVPMAIKLEGRGSKALIALPLVEELLVFRLP